MEKKRSYYFLTKTAYTAWDNKDIDTQTKMYNYVTQDFKKQWFRKVIFKDSSIPDWRLIDLAETAYNDAWVILNAEGNAGVRKITEKSYIGYLRIIFRNHYLKFHKKELAKKHKEGTAEKIFVVATGDAPAEQPNEEDSLYARVEKILSGMKDCEQLMRWRYQEAISYDEIAFRKGITKKACIHQLWRCRNYFFEKFRKK